MCDYCWDLGSCDWYCIWLHLPLDREVLFPSRSYLCKGPYTDHRIRLWASANGMVILHVWFPHPSFPVPSRPLLLFQAPVRCHNIHCDVWPHEYVLCWCDGSINSCGSTSCLPYQCHCCICYNKKSDHIDPDKEQKSTGYFWKNNWLKGSGKGILIFLFSILFYFCSVEASCKLEVNLLKGCRTVPLRYLSRC